MPCAIGLRYSIDLASKQIIIALITKILVNKTMKRNYKALDSYDKRILELLQQDASLSNLELADKVGLSPSPCSRRVQRLEEEGFISKRIAVLNQNALGLDLTAVIQINIDQHTSERFKGFEDAIRELPEVQQCYLVTGQSADYLLQVAVKDMHAYQDFLLNKITRIQGVSGVHSSFVMRKVVDSIAIPLDHLA